METALHAIDTMIAAMEKGNEAMSQVLDVARGHGDEIAELREGLAALSNRLEAVTRAAYESTGLGHCGHCGASVTMTAACSMCGFGGPHRVGESVRVLRQS